MFNEANFSVFKAFFVNCKFFVGGEEFISNEMNLQI